MAEDFAKAVEDGLKLSKRIYYGKDRAVAPPRPAPGMVKDVDVARNLYLPKSPMVYAVISDPGIVDNPDMPSYQPYVHGRCDPPALIPLHMNQIELQADCYLDTAFITVSGSWRVHCVMGSRSCDCRIAVPMGEQGSILGVEVELPRKTYSTELIAADENQESSKAAQPEFGGFLKPHIFLLTIPQVDGGTTISVKLSWSQKLLYCDGQFSLSVPFCFPGYVTPPLKKISKTEKIQLNVNCGTGTEVLCKTSSHPFKELKRQAGKLAFLYEAEVLSWSNTDVNFSYTVSPGHISGGVFLQSPSVHDIDQREMFTLYLLPGNQQSRKVFRKELVFVVDISGSMEGKPIEETKAVLLTALSRLDPGDSFSIIAFNGETYIFSTKLELASKEAVDRAIEWIGTNFVAGGGTNILPSLKKAIEMLSNSHNSIPIVLLVTDGTVEDERHICNMMSGHLAKQGSKCPRIYSFGIGSFCNHYFLQMLAMIGRGCYDAAHDIDSTEVRMQKLLMKASSTILANIVIEDFDILEEVELWPSHIPDLSNECPLIISGRYRGKFPNSIKAKGVLADMSNLVMDLKTDRVKDIPLDMLSAKQQIDLLTAQAWLSEDRELERKVTKLSIRTGFVSEYTLMLLREKYSGMKVADPAEKKSPNKSDSLSKQRTILLQKLGIGFGNLDATLENTQPGSKEEKLPEAAEMFVKAANSCCERICGYCCCICCVQFCSKLNNQCAIALTQLCAALACVGCFECCSLCCGGDDH